MKEYSTNRKFVSFIFYFKKVSIYMQDKRILAPDKYSKGVPSDIPFHLNLSNHLNVFFGFLYLSLLLLLKDSLPTNTFTFTIINTK